MNDPASPRIPIHFYVFLVVAIILAGGAGTLGGYLAGRSAVLASSDEESPAPATAARAISAALPGAEGGTDQAGVIERALPAVVSILALQSGRFPSDGGSPSGPISSGSGFFFDSKGLILTNNHVVRGRDTVRVILNTGDFKNADVVGRDPYMDLAVLKVADGVYPVLELGDSDGLRPGDPVIAIGSPLRSFQGTVTRGIVSGLGRTFPNRVMTEAGELRIDMINMIQVDAALNSGNSGGPLLDLAGRVVGLNTGREEGAEGIGFAISISDVKRHLDDLVRIGKTQHGYLGVRYSLVDDDVRAANSVTAMEGAYVVEVVADSTARAAGIQAGDVIIAVNGQAVNRQSSLGIAISKLAVGSSVEFSVDRAGDRLGLRAPLQPRPEPQGSG